MGPEVILGVIEGMRAVSVVVDRLSKGEVPTAEEIASMHQHVQAANNLWEQAASANPLLGPGDGAPV